MKEKKSLKRPIAFILMTIFVISSLSACKTTKETNGKEKGNPMGRYVEEEIVLPKKYGDSQLIDLIKNADGDIEVFLLDHLTNIYSKLIRNDSGEWVEKKQPWLSKIIGGEYSVVQNVILGEDGIYYALVQDYNGDMSSKLVFRCNDENGSPMKINIPVLDEIKDYGGFKSKPIIENISVLKSGNILLYDALEKQLCLFSQDTGERLKEFESVVPFTQKGDNIWAAKPEEKAIILYSDVETNILAESTVMEGRIAVTDKALYLLNDEGIHRLENEGSIWQTIVDGTLTSLAAPQMNFLNLCISEEDKEEYYVLLENANYERKFYRYYYDETVSAVPEKELTIYSLYDNSTIRQAINKFQNTNSDIRINYQVAIGEGSSATINDTIRALNTELLGGKGADIFVLDGLPLVSLKEKGILADISDVVVPLINDGTLISNIASSFIEDKKTYVLPVRFQVPFFYGETKVMEALESLDTLAKFIKENPDKQIFSKISYQQLASTFFLLNYNKLIDSEEKINKDIFVEFLENLSVLSNNSGDQGEVSIGSNLVQEGLLKFDNTNYLQDFEMNSGLIQAGIMQIRTVSDFVMPADTIKNNNFSYSNINNLFIPSLTIGINASSKEIDVAKEFLKTLISDEVQEASLGDGLPVNERMLTKWGKMDYSDHSMAFSDGSEMISINYPSTDEIEDIFEDSKTLTNPLMYNKLLIDGITDNITKYLAGEMSLDQTAQDTLNLINTYLSE